MSWVGGTDLGAGGREGRRDTPGRREGRKTDEGGGGEKKENYLRLPSPSPLLCLLPLPLLLPSPPGGFLVFALCPQGRRGGGGGDMCTGRGFQVNIGDRVETEPLWEKGFQTSNKEFIVSNLIGTSVREELQPERTFGTFFFSHT